MADSIFNRPMFKNEADVDYGFVDYNDGTGKFYPNEINIPGNYGGGETRQKLEPKASAVEADAGVISYPQSRITGPLGGDDTGIMEALALTRDQVDPKAYQAAMAELVPTRSAIAA